MFSLGLFALLVIFEFGMFVSAPLTQELQVDAALHNKFDITIDITLPSLPCSHLSLDAVDASGQGQLDLDSAIFTQRLDRKGNPISAADAAQLEAEVQKQIIQIPVPQNTNGCGTCYGAENDRWKCCETCDDVREAYRDKGWAFSGSMDVAQCLNEGFTPRLLAQKGEGCRVYGSLTVSKTQGNFHISPGRSVRNSHGHVHDTTSLNWGEGFNLTHRIDMLAFGPHFPGRKNPLEGAVRLTNEKHSLYQYFVKVVPTVYQYTSGEQLFTNQYSVTQHFKALVEGGHDETLPGIFFIYDSSPIQVMFKEQPGQLAVFLTKVCATAGGIFAISSLVDWVLYKYSPKKV